MTCFDSHPCILGEGPLWHPARGSLIWFDILGKTMFERRGDARHQWQFGEYVSVAGWMDGQTVLMGAQSGLWQFDLEAGTRDLIVPLEADNPVTRSNDGRADPWGGFWVGTMGIQAEPQAGAIYRYHAGEIRQIVDRITISNAICFAPDQSCAYFTDTPTQKIMRVALDADSGWPVAAPELFIDLTADGLNPDGAVTDAQGNLWIAMWGTAQVVCFGPDGTLQRRIDLPAMQPTCPAFGGPDLRDLYVTTATDGLPAKSGARDGMTLCVTNVAQGAAEPQVRL